MFVFIQQRVTENFLVLFGKTRGTKPSDWGELSDGQKTGTLRHLMTMPEVHGHLEGAKCFILEASKWKESMSGSMQPLGNLVPYTSSALSLIFPDLSQSI